MAGIIKDPTNWQARMRAHIGADELIQGQYWDDGKGCFIGCSVKGDDPAILADEIGLPVMVIRLAEVIFENLLPDQAREFTIQMTSSETLRPSADVSLVVWRFLRWLLATKVAPVAGKNESVVGLVSHEVLCPISRGRPVSRNVKEVAWATALRAVWATDKASRVELWAAKAADSAARATDAEDDSDALVAWVTRALAMSVRAASEAAASEAAAGAAPWPEMADKLVFLLREAA